jgi:hypothetical protein
LWTRGENLTQAHPKQCPVAGKEILCNKPPASNDPESGNPEEGTLLKVNPYNNWGASTQHSSNKPTPQREEAELVKPPNINLHIAATNSHKRIQGHVQKPTIRAKRTPATNN